MMGIMTLRASSSTKRSGESDTVAIQYVGEDLLIPGDYQAVISVGSTQINKSAKNHVTTYS